MGRNGKEARNRGNGETRNGTSAGERREEKDGREAGRARERGTGEGRKGREGEHETEHGRDGGHGRARDRYRSYGTQVVSTHSFRPYVPYPITADGNIVTSWLYLRHFSYIIVVFYVRIWGSGGKWEAGKAGKAGWVG